MYLVSNMGPEINFSYGQNLISSMNHRSKIWGQVLLEKPNYLSNKSNKSKYYFDKVCIHAYKLTKAFIRIYIDLFCVYWHFKNFWFCSKNMQKSQIFNLWFVIWLRIQIKDTPLLKIFSGYMYLRSIYFL